jgi:hypothetical protein
MGRRGGVGGFFARPSFSKMPSSSEAFQFLPNFDASWINRFFTSIDLDATDDLFLALRASGPIDRVESCLSAEVPESGIAIAPLGPIAGVNAKKGSGSRRCGFHLRGRIILWRGFIVRVINAISLSRSHFANGTV